MNPRRRRHQRIARRGRVLRAASARFRGLIASWLADASTGATAAVVDGVTIDVSVKVIDGVEYVTISRTARGYVPSFTIEASFLNPEAS